MMWWKMTDDSKNREIFNALIGREKAPQETIDPKSTPEPSSVEIEEHIAKEPAIEPVFPKQEADGKKDDSKIDEELDIDGQLKELLQEFIENDDPDKRLVLWQLIGKIYGTETLALRVVEEVLERFDSLENRVGELKTVLESIDNKLSYIDDSITTRNDDSAFYQKQIDELQRRIESLEKELGGPEE